MRSEDYERERAFEYAQARANRVGLGFYIYSKTPTDKDGMRLATIYYIVRQDHERPKDSELEGYKAPNE